MNQSNKSEGTTPQAERLERVCQCGVGESTHTYAEGHPFIEYRPFTSDIENLRPPRAVAPVETPLNLAAAVMKHFHHCRCDQQLKNTPPCLYCQAKEEADAR